jgi:hypothetical protein
MKKTGFTFFALLVSIITCGYCYAQDKTHVKQLSVAYTWSRIQSHGSNQIAIWIEDIHGNHIRTLFATHFTATGGYKYRPVSLSEWVEKFDLKNATSEQVDAVSGSTPQSGRQTVIWDGNDQAGKPVTPGKYILRMEANIHDADKMFFRAEINIGGADQKTTGEITYSKPELAKGEVLVKDVLVEYR